MAPHRRVRRMILSRIAPSAGEPEEVPGRLVKLDPRPLSQLELRREEVEEQLEELHHRRVGLTRWRSQLSGALDRQDDAAARQDATRRTLDRERVFALRGWSPRHSAERIRRFATANELACTIEPPAAGDEPPTPKNALELADSSRSAIIRIFSSNF